MMIQSPIDGEYYCDHCGEDEDTCQCPSREEREAYMDEEADRERDRRRGL